MAPIRTYTDWNKRPSDQEDQIEPYRKYFLSVKVPIPKCGILRS